MEKIRRTDRVKNEALQGFKEEKNPTFSETKES
jgi:hypothetical protein